MVRFERNQYSLLEQNVESYVAIIVNIDGTEETEMHRDKRDHVNKISNWVTISKFLSSLTVSSYCPLKKKK